MRFKASRPTSTKRPGTLTPGFANLCDQPRGGKTLHEWQDANLGTNGGEHGTLARIQRLGPVVTTFDINVGLDSSQEAVGASFGKNDHGIDARQGSEDLGALLLGGERTTGAF